MGAFIHRFFIITPNLQSAELTTSTCLHYTEYTDKKHLLQLIFYSEVTEYSVMEVSVWYIANVLFFCCVSGNPSVKWRIVLIVTAVSWSRLIIEKETSH